MMEFDRGTDPLGRDIPLSHETRIPVLGLPVRFASNAAAVLDVVEEAFGLWRSLPAEEMEGEAREVTVRVVVQEGDEGHEGHAPISYRMPDRLRMILTTPGSVGVTDAERREAVAYVTPALVEDRDHFRHGVLEALTLATVTRLDRQPLHASALVRGGTALLLAGHAGSGKSSVAYAGMRDGLEVLSDDTVYVQLRSRLRVWGMPRRLHLPVEAVRHFPELEGVRPIARPGGGEKIPVDLREREAVAHTLVFDRVRLCRLVRGEGHPSLERADPGRIQEELRSRQEVGFDLFEDTIGEALHVLAGPGGWTLRLGADPVAAVPLVHRIFDVVDEGAD